MKYYLYRQETSGKLRYPYIIVVADEPLIELQCEHRKSFNCNLYTELQVIEMIQKAYPEAVQISKPKSKRWRHRGNLSVLSNCIQKL